jgi:hypothetical protein
VKEGFTKAEAHDLIDRSFETHSPLPGVPQRTKGQVIEAIDADDHWNVMIEWNLAGKPVHQWFTKFEMQNYMRPV